MSMEFMSLFRVLFNAFVFNYLFGKREIEEVEGIEEEYNQRGGFSSDFRFLSLISNTEDFYKILEVDYDATEETIRSNYIRLALKCHPDKKKGEESSTSKFQELNNAYQVLADPIKRKEYNKNLVSSSLVDFKALVLTCNGLGVRHWIF